MTQNNEDNTTNTNTNTNTNDTNNTNTNINNNTLSGGFYKLTQYAKSSINSRIYAATGIKLDQKKLVISFVLTLLKDFALAYSVRAGLKILPKLLKMFQTLRIDWIQLFKECFGLESVKFGLFVSLFFSSYKVSEKIISHWNFPFPSLLAGAISSLSFIVMSGEEASFRWTLAEYTAVRALQCLYNHLVRAHPQLKPFTYYGDVALFSLSSAQLMYGYFVRPGSIDPEYRGFVERLTCTDKRIVEVNRNFLRKNTGNLGGTDLLDLALLLEDVHSIPPLKLPHQISSALISNSQISALPCSVFHFNEACPERILNVWSFIFKQALPMYFSLHLIPKLLLLKTNLRSPLKELIHTIKNTVQSSSFLASCGAIFQSILCSVRLANIPDWKYYYWLIGLIAGLGIFIEKKPRRSELALYVLPKAIQALYRVMLSKNLMIKIPRGEYILFSISISVLMNYYRREPESMTPLVSKIFKRFL